jgi:hypothetical protein
MRTLACCLALAWMVGTAAADPPKVGDSVGTTGVATWPAPKWLYDSPSANDAAGKVLVLWFCSPKPKACADDLARIISLRDTNHVYIVAFINGTQRDAKKLDPIRESEGVGRGTVAYGPSVAKIFKEMGITTGPAAIVADVDGRVKAVTTSGDLNELDARDQVVTSSISQIKEYSSVKAGPATAKPNEKFELSLKVSLASWLHFKVDSPALTVTTPKEIKCEKGTKLDGQTLAATVTCSGPKGSYQAQAKLQFGYKTPSGGDGLGEDGATWTFEIK